MQPTDQHKAKAHEIVLEAVSRYGSERVYPQDFLANQIAQALADAAQPCGDTVELTKAFMLETYGDPSESDDKGSRMEKYGVAFAAIEYALSRANQPLPANIEAELCEIQARGEQGDTGFADVPRLVSIIRQQSAEANAERERLMAWKVELEAETESLRSQQSAEYQRGVQDACKELGDLRRNQVNFERGLREAAEIAENPYGDEVKATAGDEPLAVGTKIAKATRSRINSAPPIRGLKRRKKWTKEQRCQELVSQIEAAKVDESIKGLCFTIFDRAYDNGFADGVTHGLQQSARIQDMVLGAMQPKVHRVDLTAAMSRTGFIGIHDSETCALGKDGGPCETCRWANGESK